MAEIHYRKSPCGIISFQNGPYCRHITETIMWHKIFTFLVPVAKVHDPALMFDFDSTEVDFYQKKLKAKTIHIQAEQTSVNRLGEKWSFSSSRVSPLIKLQYIDREQLHY